jgi:hypothetical protein
MSFDRTPAERRADELSAEVRRLQAVAHPTARQRVRLAKAIVARDRAWRVVHEMRQGRR